jgi:chromosome segregation ATPase
MGKLSIITPTSDPRRADLVAALHRHEAAKAAVTRHRGGLDRVRAKVRTIDGQIKVAQATIEEERAAHARAVADAAAEDTIARPSGVRAARQALTDLQDERDAVAGALDDLKAQLPDLELASTRAAADIETEINRVLQPLAAELIARERRLAAELAAVRGSLASLLSSDEIPRADFDYRIKRAMLTDLVRSEFQQRGPDVYAGPNWHEARDELRRDPNAPLPVIESGQGAAA